MTVRNAVRAEASMITSDHLKVAVEGCIADAPKETKEIYDRAVARQGTIDLEEILSSAAQCHCNDFGIFSAHEVIEFLCERDREPMALSEIQCALSLLCQQEHGAILISIASRDGLKYQFRSQMLRYYTLLQAHIASSVWEGRAGAQASKTSSISIAD
jgi:hypothetical protein